MFRSVKIWSIAISWIFNHNPILSNVYFKQVFQTLQGSLCGVCMCMWGCIVPSIQFFTPGNFSLLVTNPWSFLVKISDMVCSYLLPKADRKWVIQCHSAGFMPQAGLELMVSGFLARSFNHYTKLVRVHTFIHTVFFNIYILYLTFSNSVCCLR